MNLLCLPDWYAISKYYELYVHYQRTACRILRRYSEYIVAELMTHNMQQMTVSWSIVSVAQNVYFAVTDLVILSFDLGLFYQNLQQFSEVKFVFNSCRKRSLLSAGSRRLSGSEFQTVGPATEKARRPKVLSRWRGTVRWCRLAERRCRLLAMSETGVQQLTRYLGALSCRHRCTVTPSL